MPAISNFDCVKLKTCLPSSSFCLAVLYSFGFACWADACCAEKNRLHAVSASKA